MIKISISEAQFISDLLTNYSSNRSNLFVIGRAEGKLKNINDIPDDPDVSKVLLNLLANNDPSYYGRVKKEIESCIDLLTPCETEDANFITLSEEQSDSIIHYVRAFTQVPLDEIAYVEKMRKLNTNSIMNEGLSDKEREMRLKEMNENHDDCVKYEQSRIDTLNKAIELLTVSVC